MHRNPLSAITTAAEVLIETEAWDTGSSGGLETVCSLLHSVPLLLGFLSLFYQVYSLFAQVTGLSRLTAAADYRRLTSVQWPGSNGRAQFLWVTSSKRRQTQVLQLKSVSCEAVGLDLQLFV